MSFLCINKTLRLNNFRKTRTAMNPKISVFVICVEAIIYLLYNFHDCTFNVFIDVTWIIYYGMIRMFTCGWHVKRNAGMWTIFLIDLTLWGSGALGNCFCKISDGKVYIIRLKVSFILWTEKKIWVKMNFKLSRKLQITSIYSPAVKKFGSR